MEEYKDENTQQADMNALLRQSTESSVRNIKRQKKKQSLLFAIMLTEGVIALLAGVLTIALAHIFAIGIVLLVLGTFIAVTVGIMNVRTMKKLNTLLRRSEDRLKESDGKDAENKDVKNKK